MHIGKILCMAALGLTKHTYQLNGPVGLDLELPKRALKEPPNVLALGQLRG